MGKMSIGLKRIFDQAVREKVVSLDAMKRAKEQASHNIETIQSVENLVLSGHDLQHAIYVNALNLISLFGEEMSTLPPLHQITQKSVSRETTCPVFMRVSSKVLSPIRATPE